MSFGEARLIPVWTKTITVTPQFSAVSMTKPRSICMSAGRWEARIGIPAKVYLGLFSLETEAAQAYDRALVRLRGTAAATNFALSDYRTDLAAYHKMQQVRLPPLPPRPSPLLSASLATFLHYVSAVTVCAAQALLTHSCLPRDTYADQQPVHSPQRLLESLS